MIKKVTQLSQVGVRTLNEDKVLINEERQIFGVFDGASSLDKYLSPEGKTGAYVAANIAADTFASTDKDLRAIAIKANENIEKAHQEAGVDISNNVNRFGTTVAVAKLVDNRAEFLQLGDSTILVIDRDGHANLPLGYYDHDLDIKRKWRRLADNGAKGIRGILADDVIELRKSANTAYGVLNGDSKAVGFIKTTAIELTYVVTILILSDGMYIPKEDPDAKEDWSYYVKLYLQGGLDKIYKTVRDMEKTDPALVKYPRYKLHDDASGIAIDLAV